MQNWQKCKKGPDKWSPRNYSPAQPTNGQPRRTYLTASTPASVSRSTRAPRKKTTRRRNTTPESRTDSNRTGGGGGYLVQSTIRPNNRRMDQALRRTSRHRRHAHPSAHRHTLVAPIHRQQPERQRPLHQGAAQVRRREEPGTIPERNRNFYKLEDITWQMSKI